MSVAKRLIEEEWARTCSECGDELVEDERGIKRCGECWEPVMYYTIGHPSGLPGPRVSFHAPIRGHASPSDRRRLPPRMEPTA